MLGQTRSFDLVSTSGVKRLVTGLISGSGPEESRQRARCHRTGPGCCTRKQLKITRFGCSPADVSRHGLTFQVNWQAFALNSLGSTEVKAQNN